MNNKDKMSRKWKTLYRCTVQTACKRKLGLCIKKLVSRYFTAKIYGFRIKTNLFMCRQPYVYIQIIHACWDKIPTWFSLIPTQIFTSIIIRYKRVPPPQCSRSPPQSQNVSYTPLCNVQILTRWFPLTSFQGANEWIKQLPLFSGSVLFLHR